MKYFWLLVCLPLPAFSATPDLNLAATLGSLLFVVALILFLAWVLKKMQLPGVGGNNGPMKVIRQLAVGQKERIVLIQVGDEQLLVGVTATNINLLSKLENPIVDEDSPSTSFSHQLSQIMTKNDQK